MLGHNALAAMEAAHEHALAMSQGAHAGSNLLAGYKTMVGEAKKRTRPRAKRDLLS
jgi:hypothetical protein